MNGNYDDDLDREFQPSHSAAVVFERRRLQLLEKRNQVQESSLQSTRNVLSMINESEQVGIRTAEELLVQREKLEKVDENLDTINGGLRQTQKNLNAMKGFFNGVRSLFRNTNKPAEEAKPAAKMSNSQSEMNMRADNPLAVNINKMRSNSTQYEGLKNGGGCGNGVDKNAVDFGEWFIRRIGSGSDILV